MARIALLLAVLVALGGLAFRERRSLMVRAFALTWEDPGLSEPGEEGPGVEWFDDYYTVKRIDGETFAISEPRFAQQNLNYLILGSNRALLFDTGLINFSFDLSNFLNDFFFERPVAFHAVQAFINICKLCFKLGKTLPGVFIFFFFQGRSFNFQFNSFPVNFVYLSWHRVNFNSQS